MPQGLGVPHGPDTRYNPDSTVVISAQTQIFRGAREITLFFHVLSTAPFVSQLNPRMV